MRGEGGIICEARAWLEGCVRFLGAMTCTTSFRHWCMDTAVGVGDRYHGFFGLDGIMHKGSQYVYTYHEDSTHLD